MSQRFVCSVCQAEMSVQTCIGEEPILTAISGSAGSKNNSIFFSGCEHKTFPAEKKEQFVIPRHYKFTWCSVEWSRFGIRRRESFFLVVQITSNTYSVILIKYREKAQERSIVILLGLDLLMFCPFSCLAQNNIACLEANENYREIKSQLNVIYLCLRSSEPINKEYKRNQNGGL